MEQQPRIEELRGRRAEGRAREGLRRRACRGGAEEVKGVKGWGAQGLLSSRGRVHHIEITVRVTGEADEVSL